ncbi:hypothetical protein ACQPZA_24235 [Pseudonocardia xinjiangensis]|uniref:hypothetical protein n=1 Tax=Pseudonocardia xinjiangensis TaxID=75289 RepID=UPI003D8D564E
MLARKKHREDLKAYVKEHKRERITHFNDVHLFPGRIIRLPGFASMSSMINFAAEPEMFPVAGVSASVENTGGISGRSTLTRTAGRGRTAGRRRSTRASPG